MSSQPGSFDWNKIDQRLANLLLAEISEELNKKIVEKEREIRVKNTGNMNSLTIPTQRMEVQLEIADEWAGRIFEMYCEVWRRQGNRLSPNFLRAVCQYGIRIFISARTAAFIGELKMEQVRTRRFSPQWLSAATDSFRRNMELVFAKWERRVEVEAKSMEYMQTSGIDDPAIAGIEREITQARERIRHFEAEMATTDTKIAALQQSLTETLVKGTSALKPRDIERAIRKLHSDKKELEFRRDEWQLMLSTAWRREEEIASRHRPTSSQTAASSLEPAAHDPASRTVASAQVWRDFHVQFKALSEEERAKDPGNKKDAWLRAFAKASKRARNPSSTPLLSCQSFHKEL